MPGAAVLPGGPRPTAVQFYGGRPSGFTAPTKSPPRIIFASSHNRQQVRTPGAMFGLTCYAAKALNIGGNHSLNVLKKSNLPTGFRTFCNTSEHMYDLTASGEAHKLSYSANYRWGRPISRQCLAPPARSGLAAP
ncbi:hypothetical protein GCM10022408_02620 [Hymenobacter fastidiosus]|uniref:Uncharacterized protein n=1 Tax=Hymenobacter fastidiosus TaxID=486264 RepID=A0ABP7RCV4_9BACT